jgi:hypothetical protein
MGNVRRKEARKSLQLPKMELESHSREGLLMQVEVDLQEWDPQESLGPVFIYRTKGQIWTCRRRESEIVSVAWAMAVQTGRRLRQSPRTVSSQVSLQASAWTRAQGRRKRTRRIQRMMTI